MGKAEELKVGADTKLWIRHLDWHTPVGGDVTWYLVPSTDRQSNMPNHALGKITHFSWSDGPMEEPPADPADAEEARPSAAEPHQPEVDSTGAYRAAHLAVLGKISGWLLAIFVTLTILAAILLLKL
jgi:hypothetical protein